LTPDKDFERNCLIAVIPFTRLACLRRVRMLLNRCRVGIPHSAQPATPLMLELGAWFLRTETELILKSRRVVPGRLLQSGFDFRFPDWPSAARDLVRRFRNGK